MSPFHKCPHCGQLDDTRTTCSCGYTAQGGAATPPGPVMRRCDDSVPQQGLVEGAATPPGSFRMSGCMWCLLGGGVGFLLGILGAQLASERISVGRDGSGGSGLGVIMGLIMASATVLGAIIGALLGVIRK